MSKQQHHKKIGFIIHPLDIANFFKTFPVFYKKTHSFLGPLINEKKPYRLTRLFSKLPSHKVFHIRGVSFTESMNVDLVGVMCPMFPKEMILDKKEVMVKMKQALQIFEREKMDIVTLAGFSSIVTNGGYDIVDKTTVPVTSGNTMTSVFCIDLIRYLLEGCQIRRDDRTLAVIGATGDIGSACARALCGDFTRLVLCSRTISPDSDLVKQLNVNNYILSRDAKEAVKNADIVLTAASSIGTLLTAEDFKNGAVVCDSGMPPNVGRMVLNKRKDVKVFNGGRGRVGFYDTITNEKWKSLFPGNAVFGCFLEALLIAASGRSDLVSLGKGGIDQNKLEEFRVLAKEYNVSFSKDSETELC
ncbi:MAG: hypothetical protein AB1650_01100 [Candidatus Omnitrophota bacterium]